jgi:hypothetical protein
MSEAASHESRKESTLRVDEPPRDGSEPATPPSPEPVVPVTDPPPKGGDDDQG